MNSTAVPQVTFKVSEDEVDGGYSASALEYGIHTQAETLDELRHNIKEAVECYFPQGQEISKVRFTFDITI